jgi:hypothetical protein
MAFNCNDHFRGTGKGVGAKRHWYRAGMARLTTQCQSVTLNAANGGNEANRMVISLKDWPLFNMRFHIADNRTISSVKLGNGVRVEPEVCHCLPDRDAICVAKLEARWIKTPGK